MSDRPKRFIRWILRSQTRSSGGCGEALHERVAVGARGAEHPAGVVGPLVGVGERGGGEQAEEDQRRPDPLEGRRDRRRRRRGGGRGLPEPAAGPGRSCRLKPPVPARRERAARAGVAREAARSRVAGGGRAGDDGREAPASPSRCRVLPLLPAAKAGEAVELTCTVARSRVSCWSLGRATGSCEVSEAGRSEANLLAALSSVLRSMVILSPSSVRLADGPLTRVGGVGDRDGDAELAQQRVDGRDGERQGVLWPAAEIPWR